MNSGIIIKIEHRIFPAVAFSQLTIIPYSGKFTELFQRVREGSQFDWEGTFDVAKITDTTDQLLDSIANRKGQFRITDGNGTRHLVGNEQYPARLFFSREVSNQPGSFNGYHCKILRKSPDRSVIELQ